MAKKKNVLNVESDLNYTVFGISCHLADYRLIHFINKINNYNFIRVGELEYRNKQPRILVDNSLNDIKIDIDNAVEENSLKEIVKKEKILRFSLYLFDDKDNYITYYFISNRCEGELLFQEFKQIDFMLVLTNKLNYEKLVSLKESFKKVQSILSITEIQSSLKTKFEDLLFDIEISVIKDNSTNFN